MVFLVQFLEFKHRTRAPAFGPRPPDEDIAVLAPQPATAGSFSGHELSRRREREAATDERQQVLAEARREANEIVARAQKTADDVRTQELGATRSETVAGPV